jgi:MtrB/PioB family decaheme-associated outer membrane protein
MKTKNGHRLTFIAAAVLSAVAPAAIAGLEEELDPTELTTPISELSIGAGYATDAARRFGQYNGLKDSGLYPLFDIDYRRRFDTTGTWAIIRGRNLGLDNRDLHVEYARQGNWGAFIDFGQTPRYEPFTPITGLTGIGTANQRINGTALRPVELKTRRDLVSLGFDKFVSGGFDFQVRFSNEEKNGARLWGQGQSPFPATTPDTRFLTDPIDYTTRQWEAIANYNSGPLQLGLGYYGTQFDNQNPALFVSGTPAPIFTTMALPPGSQSHQLYLNGGYTFTPTARTTFKVGYTYATQNEAFIGPSPTGRTDLDGKVETVFANVGFTAQPLPRLTFLANLRYYDRDDNTPVDRYFTGVNGASTLSGENEPRSTRTTNGKAELAYRLPLGFRLTGGVDYEEKERNSFRVRSVSHRDRTEENAYRAELRRTIGESVTGAISYVHSDRDGSDFLTTVLNSGSAVGASNLIAPIHLADRTRDKVRATITWMVSEPLTLQLTMDEGRDEYESRTADNFGVRKGRMNLYSVDAGLQLTEKWQANAYYTVQDLSQDQATQFPGPPITNWAANLANDTETFGLGVSGKPLASLNVGADVLYSSMTDKFGIFTISGPSAVSDIPRIRTRMTRVSLFGQYEIDKNTGVRLNYVFDRWRSNEWTWTQFVYTDGTRLVQDPSQKVHFVGLTGYYRFR